MSELSIWTIYDHPTDFPNTFAARRWDIDNRGYRATQVIILGPTLDSIRAILAAEGLTPISRDPTDDPKIVEVWL